MASASKIEWTQATWNPIAGCAVVSPGCTNCYAMKMAARVEAMSAAQGRASPYDGLTRKTKAGAVWNGLMRLVESALDLPITWIKPRTIFVNSMSDLFADGVPDAWIDQVFARMAVTYRHTYQVLTKRAQRMHAYLSDPATPGRIWDIVDAQGRDSLYNLPDGLKRGQVQYRGREWPLRNVWQGVSVEDQDRANERLLWLLLAPAAIRFVSLEPLLADVDMTRVILHRGAAETIWPDIDKVVITINALIGAPKTGIPGIDLAIVGGESGPKSRACWTPNIRSIVQQCERAGVAVFVKQLGANVQDRNDAGFDGCGPTEWPDIDPDRVKEHVNGYQEDYQGAPVRILLKDRKGGDMAEWPEDLRVRQLPGQPSEGGAA